jgi:serine protease Do
MNDVIEFFRNVVIEIATPYATGTGFYLRDQGLIVTNEHVVRDNRQVVIHGKLLDKQLVKVLFTDTKYDLAFLEAPEIATMPTAQLGQESILRQGDTVIAVGHPFGLRYTATQGIVSNMRHEINDLYYIQHDAALNPGNSGGPLLNVEGRIIGVNTFVIKEGNSIGFSLPVNYLAETIKEFKNGKGKVGVRCPSCSNFVFEDTIEGEYCPHCGAKLVLPSLIEPYEPIGVPKTIEDIIGMTGHHVELSRRGPDLWEIRNGTARINISYYEKNGLISGDAYLCMLPKDNIKPIYEFLLRQNYELEGLSLSMKDQDVILSLLIFDRYFNASTGQQLFQFLFDKADHYDNILVEQYGANWKYEAEENLN